MDLNLKETKPKYFLLENVKMSKKWEKVLSGAIGVEPILINSALVSAQNRQRLYWTNIPDVTQPEDKGLLIRDILEDEVNSSFYMNKPLILNGKETGQIGILDYKDNERQKRVYSDNYKSPSLLARSDSPRIIKIGDLDMKASQQIKRVYSTEGLSPTLDTMQGGHRQPKILIENKVRKLTPLECERLQTLPDNYTEGVSNSQRYKMIGNGWTVSVIAHIFKNTV
jgi:site-specific DNA-cytosine methylase